MNELINKIYNNTKINLIFINKLTNKEYISNYLFKQIKKKYPYLIPINFDLDRYNEKILERDYIKYKDYFENMYKGIDEKIKLDKEQIKAILADEDYSLILAGAGSGKTTTMASKVKFLVDVKKVDPSKILVMSYTKKATEELEKRIVLDFGIEAKVTTFHSLGLMYIREKFKNRKCVGIDNNQKEEIFLEYFKNNIFPYKYKIKELSEIFDKRIINKHFVFSKDFLNNYEKYDTFDEYFENYKKRKLEQEKDNLKEFNDKKIEEKINNSDAIRTIKGEVVKSKGEAIIANFLYRYSVDYQYELIYSEYMPDRKVYKPDFTLNLNGEKIYLEYFGLSSYKDNELNRYNKIKKQKEKYHQENNTKFIKIDYQPNEDIIKTLKQQLHQFGFELKEKSEEEILYTLLDNNKFAEFFNFKDFIFEVIETIKSSVHRDDINEIVDNYIKSLSVNQIIETEEQDIALRQYIYIMDFYKYYKTKLFTPETYIFDFSDMIYYANKCVNEIGNNNKLNFEYLIIDEYQDISESRYLLTKKIIEKNTAKIVAVGDDWQSIYAFNGSKIDYIYHFQTYFEDAKILKITNTYRNSQELIKCSGNFVMKNENQIKKELISNKTLENPIQFRLFEENEEYKELKRIIREIHQKNKEHNILILSRFNKQLKQCYNDPELKDEIGTKIQYIGYEDIDIDGMTIHKSKGLTADQVIVIGLNNKFPSDKDNYFWLEYLFKSFPEQANISYPEERRLFYVALTRTKNYVYLLVNKNSKLRSPFLNELYDITKQNNI